LKKALIFPISSVTEALKRDEQQAADVTWRYVAGPIQDSFHCPTYSDTGRPMTDVASPRQAV